MPEQPTPVVFIPALLCDEALYAEIIASLGAAITPHVLISPKPSLAESVADILARAPEHFVLVGTSYGGNLALEIAIAAPKRVSALWLMGCNPAAPEPGGPDLAAGLTHTPNAVIDMLGGLIAHKDNTGAAALFKTMAQRVGGQAGAAQATALQNRPEITSKLAGLHMPALVLWGEDDALVPASVGKSLADHLPHAHFHALEHCGHLPTIEAPAVSASLFAAFLQDEFSHAH
jgi:pimeloyl-ACP methyl ester carboxylesterase